MDLGSECRVSRDTVPLLKGFLEGSIESQLATDLNP